MFLPSSVKLIQQIKKIVNLYSFEKGWVVVCFFLRLNVYRIELLRKMTSLHSFQTVVEFLKKTSSKAHMVIFRIRKCRGCLQSHALVYLHCGSVHSSYDKCYM